MKTHTDTRAAVHNSCCCRSYDHYSDSMLSHTLTCHLLYHNVMTVHNNSLTHVANANNLVKVAVNVFYD